MLGKFLTWCEQFNTLSDYRMNQLWEFFLSLKPVLIFLLNGICWVFLVFSLIFVTIFIVLCILAFVVWIVADTLKFVGRWKARLKKDDTEDGGIRTESPNESFNR